MLRTAPARATRRVAVALLILASGRSGAREPRLAPGMPDPSAIGRAEPEPGGRADRGADAAEEPGRLDPLFRAVDPSRLQRGIDRALGFDSDDRSRKPRAPEIGEPVFFDVTRPLGDLKYSNELNYLLNPSTGNAPTLQILEYEYTFGDWRSAELDLLYFNGRLEVLTPFYQRTLGVGRRRNWVHGYQVSPDVYLRSGFLGGSAFYIFGWKPEEESRFSSLAFFGANRALIGGFGSVPASAQALSARALSAARPDDRNFAAWRPTLNVDLFYKLGEKFSLGIENDLLFAPGEAGEFLVFPFLTYEPGKHAFFQVGGGYYRFESRDQFTFMLHLNFVNPTRRRPREEPPEGEDKGEAGTGRAGRLLRRLLGDR